MNGIRERAQQLADQTRALIVTEGLSVDDARIPLDNNRRWPAAGTTFTRARPLLPDGPRPAATTAR